ncbi:Ubiquitin-conjugating enzyme E2Q-like protein [Amphibalanus amphitrite]|uniref:Ubiquitin-conjugating enzyme E2Q-like protein n=1 Tax=Amphibalanus amphitrite TaxID=1232801 RepID=A0A6A4WWF5_AMPAM|nr:Ubiquitin-conjugating enzyme E2Q-like protein [Amphibalanus amphitrite]
MAGSFKKYILNKLGLLRSLSTDQRNGGPNVQRNNASNNASAHNAVQDPPPPSQQPAEASPDQSERSERRDAPPRAAERSLSPARRTAALRSPRQAPRRLFQRPAALDHSRVSPAHRRPASPPGRDLAHLKAVRSRRLMKEYREITRSVARQQEPAFTVELVNDCLYEWNIHLFNIDRTSDLWRDMRELRIRGIQLNMVFPENFPFSPPFLRLLSPRIERGFVMEGGAICMELLTPRGWASAYTIEAIIMQLAASLVKGQVSAPSQRRQFD